MTDQNDVWRTIKELRGKIEKLEKHYHQCHESQFPSSPPKYGYIKAGMDKFDAEKENPCWGCEYRKTDEYDWINICLQDDNVDECIREVSPED